MSSEQMAELIDKLKDITGFDEDVVGCCISNFGDLRICEASRSAGCKQLQKCIEISNTVKMMEGK